MATEAEIEEVKGRLVALRSHAGGLRDEATATKSAIVEHARWLRFVGVKPSAIADLTGMAKQQVTNETRLPDGSQPSPEHPDAAKVAVPAVPDTIRLP